MKRHSAVEIQGLMKRFGHVTAVDRISFRLEEGDVFALAGPAGAGKSTVLRMMASLLRADEGAASICGVPVGSHPEEIRRLVGYMPDSFGVYDDLTVLEYLEFFAAAHHIAPALRTAACGEKMELMNLAGLQHMRIGQLPRGELQRLGLARAVLHEPRVLLLDEPCNGLRPQEQSEVCQVLKRLRQAGRTIIVSTECLPGLDDVCTRLGLLEKGRLLCEGRRDDLLKKADHD